MAKGLHLIVDVFGIGEESVIGIAFWLCLYLEEPDIYAHRLHPPTPDCRNVEMYTKLTPLKNNDGGWYV